MSLAFDNTDQHGELLDRLWRGDYHGYRDLVMMGGFSDMEKRMLLLRIPDEFNPIRNAKEPETPKRSEIWHGSALDDTVAERLLEIAQQAADSTEIDGANVLDVVLTGSMAGYSWTETSDIDLHIVVDLSELPDRYATDYAYTESALWNAKHAIFFGGHPIEVFFEQAGHPAIGPRYSVLHHEWIVPPSPTPAIDNNLVDAKVAKWEAIALQAIASGKYDRLHDLLDALHEHRRNAIASDGEYAVENLAYRKLRQLGLIDRIKTAIRNRFDRAMSLATIAPPADRYAALRGQVIRYLKQRYPATWERYARRIKPMAGQLSLFGDEGPKEGATRVNRAGNHEVLRGGRWHLAHPDGPKQPPPSTGLATPKPAPGKPSGYAGLGAAIDHATSMAEDGRGLPDRSDFTIDGHPSSDAQWDSIRAAHEAGRRIASDGAESANENPKTGRVAIVSDGPFAGRWSQRADGLFYHDADPLNYDPITESRLDNQSGRVGRSVEYLGGEDESPEPSAEAQRKEYAESELAEQPISEIASGDYRQAAETQADEAETYGDEELAADIEDEQQQPPINDVSDFGAKIGGARKDTAVPTGPRTKKKKPDDRPAWRRAYHVGQDAKSGKWFVAYMKGKFPQPVGRDLATQEEAERMVPLAEYARKHRVYTMPGKRDEYGIYRRVTDRKRKLIRGGFASERDANMYAVEHAVEIIETPTRIDDRIHPAIDRPERTGPTDRRDNTDDSSFDDFQLYGAEFGKWNNRAERQKFLNHAYDSFLDMAEVTGLPRSMIGMQGELGIGFGSRGTGLAGADAHYEPAYGVINLTKEHGAGTLAHEWFHALDHWIGRQSGRAKAERTTADSDGNPQFDIPKTNRDHVFSTVGTQIRGVRGSFDPAVKQAVESLRDAIMYREMAYTEDKDKYTTALEKEAAKLHGALDAFRADLAKDYTGERYSPYRGKKRNLPAPPPVLEEADRLIADIKTGNYGDPTQMPTKSQYGIGPTFSGNLAQLNELYKQHRGRNAYSQKSSNWQTTVSGRLQDLEYLIAVNKRTQSNLADAERQKVKYRRVNSDYRSHARLMDDGATVDYWSLDQELSARAFEAYVYDKLKSSGQKNEFLAYEKHNDHPAYKMFGIKPYPEGDDRERINAAFDHLFDTLRKSSLVNIGRKRTAKV